MGAGVVVVGVVMLVGGMVVVLITPGKARFPRDTLFLVVAVVVVVVAVVLVLVPRRVATL